VQLFYFPFINLAASDPTWITSTLYFIVNQGRKYGFTPVLTFDQPLYLKAFAIQKCNSDSSHIVLKHGGFHTQMSYIHAICSLMDGSGLKEVYEQIYAAETVTLLCLSINDTVNFSRTRLPLGSLLENVAIRFSIASLSLLSYTTLIYVSLFCFLSLVFFYLRVRTSKTTLPLYNLGKYKMGKDPKMQRYSSFEKAK
jgi:hypothetical protein